MKPATAIVVGAATFLGVEALWALGHAQGMLRSAWIMKTGAGIGVCFLVFLVAAAVFSARQPAATGVGACARPLALGALAGIAIALAAVGPGNLWPLVLVFNGVIAIAAVFAGCALGAAFRRAADDAAAPEPETD